MPKHDRRIGRVEHINWKGIHGVDDLLARDDINQVLNDVNEKKADIDSFIIIYHDKAKKATNWRMNDDLPLSEAVFMLEDVKYSLLADEEE